MKTYSEARDIIEKEIFSLPRAVTEVPLLNALGRITAEEILADTDIPSFDHSAVDGFALRLSHHTQWTIAGEITAGNFRDIPLSDSTAVSVMTGGKIPGNTDAVIPIEDVRVNEDKLTVFPDLMIKKGMNIRYAGEDLKKNNIALPACTKIQPKNVSLLAACGKTNVRVFEQLIIGVLSTGDELVEISEMPSVDKIRATNRYALLSAVKQCNLTPVDLGLVGDAKDILRRNLSEILQNGTMDVLITTGGVSVGKHDYMQDVWRELGVMVHFWKVNIKPGKPLLFGTFERNDKKIVLFGLPGNPVSAFVNFEIFVKPAIQKFYFQDDSNIISAKALCDIKKKDNKRHFIRGRVKYQKDHHCYEVENILNQSSGNMAGLSASNCFLVLEEDRNIVQKGDWVECILI